jgi:hypothetical protein
MASTQKKTMKDKLLALCAPQKVGEETFIEALIRMNATLPERQRENEQRLCELGIMIPAGTSGMSDEDFASVFEIVPLRGPLPE